MMNSYCYHNQFRNKGYTLTNLFLSLTTITILTVLINSQLSQSARTRLRNTLDVKFNFNCSHKNCTTQDPNVSAVNLFQVSSSNPDSQEKTNYIWSTIGGPPMIIATSSSEDSNLVIDWDTLLKDPETTPSNSSIPPKYSAFHFDITPNASIGLLLEKIILFNGDEENSIFNGTQEHIELPWSDIIWDLASKTPYYKDDFLKTSFRMKQGKYWRNGTITIKLALPRDYRADRQKEVPHLKLNNQSISMVVIVDGILPPKHYTRSLLHMTYVVVVQSPTHSVSDNQKTESLISDEYTPGVFRMRSIQFTAKRDKSQITKLEYEPATGINREDFSDEEPLDDSKPKPKPALYSDKLAFIYWKEVAYTDKKKIISKTIDVADCEYAENSGLSTLPEKSTPFYQYFKYQPDGQSAINYTMYRFKLDFGRKDSYYNDSRFVDFSFVIGLGAAPQEQMFSFFLKIVMLIGFCLPILVMIAGLAYLMLRRFSQGSDTELLLAFES